MWSSDLAHGGGRATLKPRYEESSLTHGLIAAWASSLARAAWAVASTLRRSSFSLLLLNFTLFFCNFSVAV